MAKVVALYRYPVKGFTPEVCETLTALRDGRIAGDRVLGLRFADSVARDGEWSSKHDFAVLVNTPGLARLALRYDHVALRLHVSLNGVRLVEDGLDSDGRERIAAALQEYLLGLGVNPLSAHPDRLPLRLVGDGKTPRYQDNEAGQITLHSRESLAAVAAAAGDPALSEVRFRSNIAIEGVKAWQEHYWFGRRLRIGKVEFDVVKHKTRCLATHANPRTGERDLPLMTMLVKAFGQKEPTFAVGMVTGGAGGEIRVGDEVALVGKA
jgi:uncharacterized protein YcbX